MNTGEVILKEHISKSPQIADIPTNASSRFIDSGMLHFEASLAGFNERYRRGETSHTVHVWWARRPHSAMRALLFASICKDSSDLAEDILKQLSTTSLNQNLLKNIRKYLRSQYRSNPKVLDMFGGGGTIAFESNLLGFDTFSVDINELSVFIQKCNLVYAKSVVGLDVEKALRDAGQRVLNKVKADTEWLYPLRKKYDEAIFGYLWSYSIKCEDCGYKHYLIKRPWLTKKKGRNIAFVVKNEENSQTVDIEKVSNDYKYPSSWVNRSGSIKCPKCGSVTSGVDIKKCNDEMLALIMTIPKQGKSFIIAEENAIPSIENIRSKEQQLLDELKISLPKTRLPKWSGIVNPALYGIETHSEFLNPRQRLLLVYLIRALREEFRFLKSKYTEEVAKYIIGHLSSMIDQLVDWNSRLSMWIPQNEQVGRSFCGPGVAMIWDYVETDPLLKGPANLWDKLERIISGAKSFTTDDNRIIVRQAKAQQLPFEDEFFDAIVTDPPYYDNIYYSVLADFFYAWKRLILIEVEPDLFKKDSTDNENELVASTFRSSSPKKAHEKYCIELERAISEAARVLKKDGILSFVYSHSSINAWDAIIRAFRNSTFIITSVQPLSIERKQRPRAMTSEAVNTCVIFVARKTEEQKREACIDSIISAVKEIIQKFSIPLITNSGWNENDAALAAFANGVGLIANASKIVGVKNDREALLKIAEIVKQAMPGFVFNKRYSL